MMLPLSIIVVSLAVGTEAGSYMVHERRSPQNFLQWMRRPDSPHLGAIIPLSIGLKQRNLDTAENELLEVSDPDSPLYSQYWSADKVASHFAPDPRAIATVATWLEDSGVDQKRLSYSLDRSWITFNTTVREAELLLKTRYYLFYRRGEDIEEGDARLGCDMYSLPLSVREYVEIISPTVHLGLSSLVPRKTLPLLERSNPIQNTSNVSPSLAAKRTGSALPSSCSSLITPDCLRGMYKIPQSTTSHPDNSFGIYEVAWASWLPADLDMFFDLFEPSLVGTRPTMALINGGFRQDTIHGIAFNLEPDLDFEFSMALTSPQPVVNYQVGDMYQPGTLNSLLAAFDKTYCPSLNTTIDGTYPNLLPGGHNQPADCGTLKPTNVISVSWANNEVNYPEVYLRRQCHEFLKLGLMGVSVIVSSADCGAAGQSCQCIDPATGLESDNQNVPGGRFNPTTPASCPYVTVVGGTQFPANGSTTSGEVAMRQNISNVIATSGGGFSNIFSTPAYQLPATNRYLSLRAQDLQTVKALFNPHGRGIPDVAAHSANFITAIDGQFHRVFGTSASAPVFASIIVKINDERLRRGKRPVGFLNPALYKFPHALNDVVQGSNTGCGGTGRGFNAAPGWDPVTGLGTPDYERLLQLYLNLP